MVLVLLLTIYALISFYLLRRSRLLKLVSLFNIATFIIGLLWLGEGAFPGKPDQLRYLNYGKDCAKHDSLSMMSSIKRTQALKKIKESNTAYPLFSCAMFKSSLSPVISLRLVNFIAHLLMCVLVLLFYENFKLNKEGEWAALIVGVLPSVLAFDLIIMRDLLIAFFSITFLVLPVCLNRTYIFRSLALVVGVFAVFTLRPHLVPPMLLGLMTLFGMRFFRWKVTSTLIFGLTLFIGLVLSKFQLPSKNLQLYLGSFGYFFDNLSLFMNKAPVEILGYSFLLPDKTLGLPIDKILLNRFLIFDSLIIPAVFLALLVVTFKKRRGEVEGIVLYPMLIYYMTYFFLEYGQGRHLPYSFRVSLPFHVLMAAAIPFLWKVWKTPSGSNNINEPSMTMEKI